MFSSYELNNLTNLSKIMVKDSFSTTLQTLQKVAPPTFSLLGLESCGKSTFVQNFLSLSLGIIKLNVGTKCPFIYHMHPSTEIISDSSEEEDVELSSLPLNRLEIDIPIIRWHKIFPLVENQDMSEIQRELLLQVDKMIQNHSSYEAKGELKFTHHPVHIHMYKESIQYPFIIKDLPGIRTEDGSQFIRKILAPNLEETNHVLILEGMEVTVSNSLIQNCIEKCLKPLNISKFSIVKTRIDNCEEMETIIFKEIMSKHKNCVIYFIGCHKVTSTADQISRIDRAVERFQSCFTQLDSNQEFIKIGLNSIRELFEIEYHASRKVVLNFINQLIPIIDNKINDYDLNRFESNHVTTYMSIFPLCESLFTESNGFQSVLTLCQIMSIDSLSITKIIDIIKNMKEKIEEYSNVLFDYYFNDINLINTNSNNPYNKFDKETLSFHYSTYLANVDIIKIFHSNSKTAKKFTSTSMNDIYLVILRELNIFRSIIKKHPFENIKNMFLDIYPDNSNKELFELCKLLKTIPDETDYNNGKTMEHCSDRLQIQSVRNKQTNYLDMVIHSIVMLTNGFWFKVLTHIFNMVDTLTEVIEVCKKSSSTNANEMGKIPTTILSTFNRIFKEIFKSKLLQSIKEGRLTFLDFNMFKKGLISSGSDDFDDWCTDANLALINWTRYSLETECYSLLELIKEIFKNVKVEYTEMASKMVEEGIKEATMLKEIYENFKALKEKFEN